MGLEALTHAWQAISGAFGGVSGIGSILVFAGLGILLTIGVGVGLYILINLVKQIPKMTPWEFLKFVVFSAITLIVIGIILP